MTLLKKHPLAYFGAFFILLGIVVLLLVAFGIRALNAHDEWFVPHFFGPGHSPAYTYDVLYDYTIQLVELRGRAEFHFYYTLAGACVIIGGILIAWGCDRKRLRDFKKQSPNADGKSSTKPSTISSITE